MKSSPCQWFDLPAHIMERNGVFRWGIAEIAPVDTNAQQIYHAWISAGHNASMTYLERYNEVRANPELLLPDAKSIICCAFPYFYPISKSSDTANIALYALGDDYHEVLRNRLESIAKELRQLFGGETRVCVDTAPLRERYWAERSGLGCIGINNHLIIPGAGSFFFLGEIISTVAFHPTHTLTDNPCNKCMCCVKACPTGALRADGTIDASKCLSYLTIEHRGELPTDTNLHDCLYGCDACGKACPLNTHPAISHIPEFQPRQDLLSLTLNEVATMNQPTFSTLFAHSAIKRTKLTGLQRNAISIISDKHEE